MDRCQYRVQCVRETYGTALKRKSEDFSRTKDGESEGHFGTEAEEILRVKRGKAVEEDLHIEETVSELWLVFL